ncbi:hypothetical protein F4679DRAFT_535992 [Xylaria curta]|nr:hypothetical protein F4679DRAFT_535992 [Xylaria curta]
MQAFNPSFPQAVGRYAVVFKFAICPYLSIEFKKTPSQITKAALYQLIVASTIALYNRYRLKCKVCENKKWTVADYKQLRHYISSFTMDNILHRPKSSAMG